MNDNVLLQTYKVYKKNRNIGSTILKQMTNLDSLQICVKLAVSGRQSGARGQTRYPDSRQSRERWQTPTEDSPSAACSRSRCGTDQW